MVVFASGNDNNSTVNYPARLDDVIAVGASSPCDERKSPTSCDGETNWGSNFGPELDVVAPGVVISTTDIMGSGGYDSGNYAPRFNGTSSATPHVAGLAALILSVNPNLTASDVQSIIETTADDILSQGFDNETGHGRINAAKALGVAQLPSTRGPQIPPGAVVGACYRVLPGDTIFTLAAQFGLDPNYINQVNDLYPPNYVYPQQILFLPARPGNGYNAYMVKPGDTFQSIAEQCHIDAWGDCSSQWTGSKYTTKNRPSAAVTFPPFSITCAMFLSG
ncbi:MAG: S8 family serine peptidase [Anaerolineae bacterium]